MFKCNKCEKCKYDNGKRNYKLYLLISPSNKRYYGITNQEKCEYRWLNGKGYHRNEHFTSAINKYGWENFKHIILFDNLTKEEACLLEQMYITLYDTTNRKYGYNNSLGGEHGLHSEESKNKISESLKGKHHTEEHKNKISESMKGHKFTKETRKKISEANKGHETTEETRKKISEANKGKKLTEEHKNKISEGNKGKKLTEETRKKISECMKGKNKHWGKDNPNAKPVLMFTKEGEFIKRFDCVVEANKYFGKPRNNANINMCAKGRANGRNTTAYGYIWIYEEDYIK